MPERLSFATVAAVALLAAAVFGGAYALAHDPPAQPARAPTSPRTIKVEREPIAALHRVSPLPALIVPPPRPKPAPEPEPVVEEQTPVVATPEPDVPAAVPTPTPAPAPTPTPAPKPKPVKKPLTFDDSG